MALLEAIGRNMIFDLLLWAFVLLGLHMIVQPAEWAHRMNTLLRVKEHPADCACGGRG